MHTQDARVVVDPLDAEVGDYIYRCLEHSTPQGMHNWDFFHDDVNGLWFVNTLDGCVFVLDVKRGLWKRVA